MTLEVRNVDSFYGDLQVLRNVSLGVEDGEVVALLGPNGHGKRPTHPPFFCKGIKARNPNVLHIVYLWIYDFRDFVFRP